MESGGSGPEKDDPPGKTDLHNTQLLCSSAALSECGEKLILANLLETSLFMKPKLWLLLLLYCSRLLGLFVCVGSEQCLWGYLG